MTKNKITHKENIAGNLLTSKITHKDNIADQMLTNKITHKDNIVDQMLTSKVTHKDNIKSNKDKKRKEAEKKIIEKVKKITSSITDPIKEYAKKEIEKSKEDIKKEIAEGSEWFTSEVNKFSKSDRYNHELQVDNINNNPDEAFLNYLDFANSNKDFVLTADGYMRKDGYKSKLLESKIGFYSADIGIGILRGWAKLAEGIGGGGLAVLEKLDLISDGTVNEFGKYFEENVYAKIGETETMAGGFAEGFSQFLTPGIGYYKLFGGLLKIKGAWSWYKKALVFSARGLSAEAATVATAQVPGDPNFVSFISGLFKVDTSTANNFAEEFWNYLATPEDVSEGYNASDVFTSKGKAIMSDSPLGLAAETIVPLFSLFGKAMKKLKKAPNLIKEMDQKLFARDFEKYKTKVIETGNVMAAIKKLKGNEGFSITIDGKAPKDLGYDKGYMVAPLKVTEIKLKANFTDQDLLKILENVYALEKSLKINRVDYGEVYVGAWKNADGTYVFDASVRIDNLDEAIYIAQSGKQDAIFDLSKLDTIDTSKGYEGLKQDKLLSTDKAVKQRGTTSKIKEKFGSIRTKIQTGSAI